MKNKKTLVAIIAAIVVLAMVGFVIVNNNSTISTNNSSSMSEISSDVNSNSSEEENSESLIIGTAPDDEESNSNNGDVIDFPDDENSSSENSSSSKEETLSVTTPNSSSSTNVIVVPPSEDDTPSKPSDIKWNGGYDNLVGDGYDHIKVPTLDSFNNNSFDEEMKDEAFNADSMPSDWADAWWNAYDDFLIANGSPVTEDGEVLGAFMSINPGWMNNYQYLYYGVNFSGDTNGWGDLNLYPSGAHPDWANAKVKYEDFKDAYFLEMAYFTYGDIDETLTKDYRSATTMLLSWVCPNPAEVEKTIYEAFVSDNALDKHFKENGFSSWFQVGEIDICIMMLDFDNQVYIFAIREHR